MQRLVVMAFLPVVLVPPLAVMAFPPVVAKLLPRAKTFFFFPVLMTLPAVVMHLSVVMKSSRVVLVSLPSSEYEFATRSDTLAGPISTSFAVRVQKCSHIRYVLTHAQVSHLSSQLMTSLQVACTLRQSRGVLFKDVREGFLVLSPQLSSSCSLSLQGTVVLSLCYIKAAPYR